MISKESRIVSSVWMSHVGDFYYNYNYNDDDHRSQIMKFMISMISVV